MMWDKLVSLLRKRGMTLTQLSNDSGVPYATLNSWRRVEHPRAKGLRKVAEALGVSPSYFQTEEEKNLEARRKWTPQGKTYPLLSDLIEAMQRGEA